VVVEVLNQQEVLESWALQVQFFWEVLELLQVARIHQVVEVVITEVVEEVHGEAQVVVEVLHI
jgi:hypothetical protein